MNVYPHSTQILLTDDIFVSYGGETGTSTALQRTNAFMISEERVSADIGSLLLPTIVTGTFFYSAINAIVTDYAYVHRILGVTVRSRKGDSSCTFTENSACAYIRHDSYGVLDVNYTNWASCGCGVSSYTPYHILIAYEAGLPTGTASQPNVLQALTMMANVYLNEMIPLDRANESTGDIGVQSFGNQDYSEQRVKLINTALGNSAIANMAHRLLTRYRRSKYGGL